MDILEVIAAQKEYYNNLFRQYFEQAQAVRIGESTIASKRVHEVDQQNLSRIIVCSNLDAGKFYLGAPPERFLHLDTFHSPGKSVALISIQAALEKLLASLDPNITFEIKAGWSWVHLLIAIDAKHYVYLPLIIATIEDCLLTQGIEIYKIEELVHRQVQVAPSWVVEQNRNRVLLNLGSCLGSIEEATRLLSALDSSRNNRPKLTQLSSKHGGLTIILNQLINDGIVKRGLWGYKLTAQGAILLDYAEKQKRELEAEFRKTLRKVAPTRKIPAPIITSGKRRSRPRVANRGKAVPLGAENGAANLAITETVVTAVKNSLIRGEAQTKITRDDLQVYRRPATVPTDILLLIDASTSMRGKRIRAALHLAEHLVLTTRERVGVVVFQNNEATVASGFTRNQTILQQGLRTIVAGGLTPLASGISESLELIRKTPAKNPLLVLITDGMPTSTNRSGDPLADALEAATLIPENKVQLVVIGLKADAGFLQSLAEIGKGTLYLVEELELESLISIVRRAKYTNRRYSNF